MFIVCIINVVGGLLSYIVWCQCFVVVGFRQERHLACKKLEWWDAGIVICLEQGADLHMALQMPLPLTVSCFSKIQIGLPFWYRLTWVPPPPHLFNGLFFRDYPVELVPER